jgi:signal transduction histidine kinase/FixJ family two-component response regulator
MSPAPLARILIVDDEAAHMRALCDTLRDQGYETTGFATGDGALAALQEKKFDLLLTDLMMQGMNGVTLLSAALKLDPQLAGILMTGKGTIETAVQAMQAGALDYILKPFNMSTLLPVLARAIEVQRLRLENLELRNTLAIHELNQAIAHTLDPNVLLDKIADAALAQFDADEVSIMLLTDDGKSLFVAAVRGERRNTLLGAHMPVGEGIAGWVAASREPLMQEGEVRNARCMPAYPRAEIKSALSMPMITRNKLIGVLNVNCIHQLRTFTSGQVKALSIFTNAAAAGIEAARLHEALRLLNAGLEQRVHERTRQLETTNKELESFSYTVSHDLRAPLRAIEGFARILEEDHGARFDHEGRRVIGVIRDNAQRMRRLIDDLLEFSRLGRKPIAAAAIDMTALVRETIDELNAQDGARLHAFEIGDLPGALGDRALLKQVWMNLLSNAIKFSAKCAQPAVEAGGRGEGKELIYWVKDNGAGFDMRFCEKLFGVFQRLHAADEFPGTGVGLAIVQRIVVRHGGRVWAESRPGEGAVFYFSLPKRE